MSQIELRRYGLRGNPILSRSPLEEPDPAVFLEAEPAVDRVAHLRGTENAYFVAETPCFLQRRKRNSRPDTPAPGTPDGEDEVDAYDPGTDERSGRGHGLAGQ